MGSSSSGHPLSIDVSQVILLFSLCTPLSNFICYMPSLTTHTPWFSDPHVLPTSLFWALDKLAQCLLVPYIGCVTGTSNLACLKLNSLSFQNVHRLQESLFQEWHSCMCRNLKVILFFFLTPHVQLASRFCWLWFLTPSHAHTLLYFSPPKFGSSTFVTLITATASWSTSFSESHFPSNFFFFSPLQTCEIEPSKYKTLILSFPLLFKSCPWFSQLFPDTLTTKALFLTHFSSDSFLSTTFQQHGTSCISLSPVQSHPWSLCTFCPPCLEHSPIPNCCLAPTPHFVLSPSSQYVGWEASLFGLH